ncbi:MAG: hypothetical protein KBS46_00855, partial [Clostridiales bacterium]|nr:hypothetical protein [Candidatus Apopatocola equi]
MKTGSKSDSREAPFRSIRARGMRLITVLVLSAALLAVGAFTLLLFTRTYADMSSTLQERANTEATLFRSYISRTREDYLRTASALAAGFSDRNILELQFISTEGEVEISSTGIAGGSVLHDADVQAAFRTAELSCERCSASATGERIMAASAPLCYSDGSVAGLVRVVTSLRSAERRLMQTCLTAALVGLGVLMLVFISNWLFLNTITRPIVSLTNVAQRIAGGSYG